MLTYNVEKKFPAGTTAEDAAFGRVLLTIAPDVISMNEIGDGTTAGEVKNRLEGILGGTWTVNLGKSDSFNMNCLASRYPLTMMLDDSTPASEVRGITMGLVDLPNATYSTDLFAMSIHFKSGSTATDDPRRQTAADASARWFNDLSHAGGNVNVPANTPFVLMGDTNFYDDFVTQFDTTMRTGDIVNNATYGPDVKGDWDDTDMGEATPLNVYNYTRKTWPSTSATGSSRIDRFYYTDSAMTIAQCFVFNPSTMTAAQRLGPSGNRALQSTDTSATSDHNPVVCDFAVAPFTVQEPLYHAVYTTEFMADPSAVSDTNGEWFELYNPGAAAVNINGYVLKDEGSEFHRVDSPNPVLVPAGGFLVLGRNATTTTNGNVPVDYSYGATLFMANSAGDAIELYRGSMKIDGVRFNGGAQSLDLLNVDWGAGPQVSGQSRMMTGDYSSGPTNTFAQSTVQYNSVDKGTPGSANEPTAPLTSYEAWMIY